MIDEKDIVKIQTPSKQAIAKASAAALGAALLILFTVILPAEYGFDPLHTGAALGLTSLSKAAPPAAAAVVAAQPAVYKVHSEDLVLHPGEGVEVKFHMQKGATMVYSWKASGKLAFEFHGEPDQKPTPDYYDSYELDDRVGKDASHGAFVAPSTGIHGWFWENKQDQNVEIHLTAAGFFDAAKMFAGGDPQDLPIEDAK